MRDKQKQRLYSAELVLKSTAEFKTVTECQKFVNKVLSSKSVIDNFGKFEIIVTDGRGKRNASAVTTLDGQFIALPRWARSQYVILHELAHHLQTKFGENDWKQKVRIGQDELAYQSHGARFTATLLWLVRKQLGKDYYNQLCESMHKQEIKTMEMGRIVSVSLPRK